MIQRYAHIQFIDKFDPDEVSMIIHHEKGEYVKFEDHDGKISMGIAGLKNLRDSNMQGIPAALYNEYVNSLIEALK